MTYKEKDIFDDKIRRITDNVDRNKDKAKQALTNAYNYFNKHADHSTETYARVNDILTTDLKFDVKYQDLTDTENCVESIDNYLNIDIGIL